MENKINIAELLTDCPEGMEFLGGIHILQDSTTSYCYFDRLGILDKSTTTCVRGERPATEEEKQKLFDAIKEKGYMWNAETKTLEKLIEPKFKVGAKVLWNYDTKKTNTISKVKLTENRGYVYWIDTEGCSSGWWGENELTPIPDKFDISTLIPFESRVLVRDNKLQKWFPAIWGFYDSDFHDYPHQLVGGVARYCIPYEGNEHLLGTTDDCDDFYKTWG